MSSFHSGTQALKVSQFDRVVVLEFNRPEQRNAFTPEVLAELGSLLRATDENAEIDGVVLSGTGTAFCAGGDMAEETAPSDDSLRWLQTQQKEIVGRLHRFSKPVVAALPGVAAGAGVGIALACAMRIGTAQARFVGGFLGVGLSGDFGTTWLAHHMMGAGRAESFLLMDKRVDADEAVTIGLLHELVQPEELVARAIEIIRSCVHTSLPAYLAIRDNLLDATKLSLDQAMEAEAARMYEMSLTKEHQQLIERFSKKR